MLALGASRFKKTEKTQFREHGFMLQRSPQRAERQRPTIAGGCDGAAGDGEALGVPAVAGCVAGSSGVPGVERCSSARSNTTGLSSSLSTEGGHDSELLCPRAGSHIADPSKPGELPLPTFGFLSGTIADQPEATALGS